MGDNAQSTSQKGKTGRMNKLLCKRVTEKKDYIKNDLGTEGVEKEKIYIYIKFGWIDFCHSDLTF